MQKFFSDAMDVIDIQICRGSYVLSEKKDICGRGSRLVQ